MQENMQVSAYNCSFEWLIQSYHCKETPSHILHAEKMAEIFLLNVFRTGFPAHLFLYI